MPPSATDTVAPVERRRVLGAWLLALVPLLLIGALIVVILRTGPASSLQPAGVPPVERLSILRVELTSEGFVANVLNDGPDPVSIAQVQVDDAYWQFTAEPGTELRHLRRATLRIPYPWVEGEAHRLKLVTSTGATFEHEIPVAVETPKPDSHYFTVFALIGLYVGVIPVAIGLLWFPLMSKLGRSGLDFVLALTIGLLLFLMVDATAEGLEVSEALPSSFQGTALFAFAAAAAYVALAAVGRWLRRRRSSDANRGLVLALLIAVGIGVHNFGEGLAIGAAFALGEVVLGSLLIIGFALHNTTEGLAIVAPLAKHNRDARGGYISLWTLARLGLIGGAPTIVGAWIGGFVYSPIWALVFLAIGVGAIAQVVVQIVGQMLPARSDEPLGSYLASGPVAAGLLAGFIVMYATGMLIG